MLEPLFITAGVVGLTTFGTNVTLSLIDIFTSFAQKDSEVSTVCGNLEDLLGVLRNLEAILQSREFKHDEVELKKILETWVEKAVRLIHEQKDKWQKFQKTPSESLKSRLEQQKNRLIFPFQKRDLLELTKDIAEARNTLSLALNLLSIRDQQRLLRNYEETKVLVDLFQAEQNSSGLFAWFQAPDVTIEHNAACAKKHPGTGQWLIENLQFLDWLTKGNSIIWLHGFAGSGKSVLCSTAIQFLFRRASRHRDTRIGIAFFYFTCNDQSKQDEMAMLRALLFQLSAGLKNDHRHLRLLRTTHESGTPSESVLTQYLQLLCKEFSETYIVIDAIDESPRDGPRKKVLKVLDTIQNWRIDKLHLLLTSRDEPDIASSLGLPKSRQIPMANTGLDQDILKYVESRLDTDSGLRRWYPYRDKIVSTLCEKANGMYAVQTRKPRSTIKIVS